MQKDVLCPITGLNCHRSDCVEEFSTGRVKLPCENEVTDFVFEVRSSLSTARAGGQKLILLQSMEKSAEARASKYGINAQQFLKQAERRGKEIDILSEEDNTGGLLYVAVTGEE